MSTSSLYDTIIRLFNELSQITSNETLSAFDLDNCKRLDDESKSDRFVASRVKNTIKELSSIEGIDYDEHCRTAYESYNEAVTYLAIKDKGIDIKNIPEASTATPDFEIMVNCSYTPKKQELQPAYLEVKTLGFANGNNIYKQTQVDSLKCQIEMEEQHKRGFNICTAERSVMPLGPGTFSDELVVMLKKIENNIKAAQFAYSDGKSTVLFVDLNQICFTSGNLQLNECLPVYPEFAHSCSCSGMYWNLAFGRIGDRIYKRPEFEGKGNFDKDLQHDGVLTAHADVKGVIFGVGSKIENKRLYGFYRYEDTEEKAFRLIETICDFYNDDRNSFGFIFFKDELEKVKKWLCNVQQ